MDTSLAPLMKPILARTPVATIDEVLARLDEIAAALPAGDGVAAFAKLYGAVTAQVRGAVGGGGAAGPFQDPAWLARLDVVFANLFFDALGAFCTNDARTPRAWWPLFSLRSNPAIAPLQFAFAGVNAHINRDLPVALVSTCREMNRPLAKPTPEHADYVAVNPILTAVEQKIKADYLGGALAAADHLAGKLDDRLASWSLIEARAAAWTHGEALWALRGLPGLAAAFLDSLDGLVGFAGRGLLLPL